MALTALCAEVRIKNRIDELDLTCAHLSKLDGIPNSRLSEALRGIRDLPVNDAQRLLDLTARLIQLRDSFAPLPINWRNPTDVRWMLDNLTASPGEISSAVTGFFKEKDQ